MAKIIRHVPKHPLPRSIRHARKGGPSSSNDRAVKRNRVFGNRNNRLYYKSAHAHRLNPKRYSELCRLVDAANGFSRAG